MHQRGSIAGAIALIRRLRSLLKLVKREFLLTAHPKVETDGLGGVTMILPGETEGGSAQTQPCRGIAWWAHRNDEWKRWNLFLALLANPQWIGRLTESALSPFQAEPIQI
jgi:hypothetical protein